ncbi:MAG: NAD-dependent epimerase/dehydratase family protein [Nanoarchaeota archaeon]|nr:NAD-dependent epimerase/dehydratase family protein [Nanoarchaeota archaeon]
MKIMVTGGAGFIGSHVVDRLVNEGHDVSVLDDLSTGLAVNINKGAKLYEGDVKRQAGIILKIVRPDFLIHHAAQIDVRSSVEDPLNDARQNIIGSLSLIEACREYGIHKIVFASSGGTVYGNSDDLPIKESAELKPENPYGIAKATIEKYLQFYFEKYGIDYVALRYSNVYGPRQNPKGEAGVISVFIDQMLKEETPCIWGDGNQTRDFVYVEDVVNANLAALRYSGNNHIFNIGSQQETSVNEVFDILRPTLDSKEPSYNPEYKEPISRIYLDSSLALQELNWKPKIGLDEGIKRTVEWFKGEKR